MGVPDSWGGSDDDYYALFGDDGSNAPDQWAPDDDDDSSSTSSSGSGGHPNASGSPIGSGYLDIDVDPETGEVNESIGGGGITTPTTPETEDDTDVVDVDYQGGSSDTFTDAVERVEQAVEDATNGAGFGDPSTVDDIGSGDAVVDVTPPSPSTEDLPFEVPSTTDATKWLLAAAALFVGLVVGVFGDGED